MSKFVTGKKKGILLTSSIRIVKVRYIHRFRFTARPLGRGVCGDEQSIPDIKTCTLLLCTLLSFVIFSIFPPVDVPSDTLRMYTAEEATFEMPDLDIPAHTFLQSIMGPYDSLLGTGLRIGRVANVQRRSLGAYTSDLDRSLGNNADGDDLSETTAGVAGLLHAAMTLAPDFSEEPNDPSTTAPGGSGSPLTTSGVTGEKRIHSSYDDSEFPGKQDIGESAGKTFCTIDQVECARQTWCVLLAMIRNTRLKFSLNFCSERCAGIFARIHRKVNEIGSRALPEY